MKWIVLLSVLTVGMCAPLGETEQAVETNNDESEASRVKRAQEIMMFGNQQNEAGKEVDKRIDPSINGDRQTDIDGLIIAKEPKAIENNPNEELSELSDDNGSEEANDDTAESENDVADSQGTVEMNEESSDDSTDADEVPVDSKDVALTDDSNSDDGMSFDDYLAELEKIQGKGAYGANYLSSLLKPPSVPNRGFQAYGLFNYPSSYAKYGRYRRSQVRTFNGYPYHAARMLKRGHRTKRNAYDQEDFDFYLPYEMPYNYPVTEEEMAELLDLLDTPRPYDDSDVLVDPYETYAPYEEPDELEFESPIYIQPKRQAGLTFVPGIKRSSDFYPYFKEPETHYSAFIPDKRSDREYADAYQRVMELAAALRQQEEDPYTRW